MKEKILDILEKHYHGRNHIESRCADELLDLFNIVGQSEQLINFLTWHDSENLGCLPDGVEGRVDEYLKLIDCT